MRKVFFALLVMGWAHLVGAYEFAITSMFRNEASYLKEWIEYHRLVGAEHFFLYNDKSTDNWEEVLQPYIDQGIVDITYWPTTPGADFRHNQVSAFKDAIRRNRETTTWMAFIDVDEFILPMQGRSIPECLNRYFSEAAAVYVNWRNFGTGGVYVSKGDPILFQLTAASFAAHSENAVGKSILRPEAVDVENVWYPHHFTLKPDAYYLNGNLQRMTFRETDLPTDGKHYDRYIRINHYALRDEGFYRNSRLAKVNQGFGDKNLLLEHYNSFSKMQDYAIVNFLRKNYPMESHEIWKN